MISSDASDVDVPQVIERLNVWNLQGKAHGFQRLYSESIGGGGAGERFRAGAGSFGPAPDIAEEQTLDQMLADAYAKGFAEAEKLKDAAATADKENADKLAASIDKLKPQSDALISKLLLKSVHGLTIQAIGRIGPDGDFLKAQAEKLAALIHESMGDAALHIHPNDLDLFGEFECGVKIIADANLLRGTLRIVHSEGWIEQGTQPLLDELQNMLDEMEVLQ